MPLKVIKVILFCRFSSCFFDYRTSRFKRTVTEVRFNKRINQQAAFIWLHISWYSEQSIRFLISSFTCLRDMITKIKIVISAEPQNFLRQSILNDWVITWKVAKVAVTSIVIKLHFLNIPGQYVIIKPNFKIVYFLNKYFFTRKLDIVFSIFAKYSIFSK